MVCPRIIAKLLIDENGIAVKYKQFTRDRRIVGDPVALVKTLNDQRVDEFLLCWLGEIDVDLLRRMTASAFVPAAVAGSVRTMEQAVRLFHDAGVEMIVTRDPALGPRLADHAGAQAVLYPVNYHGIAPVVTPPPWAGGLVLTSIDRDGMGAGLDLDAMRGMYNIPVVLAGGVGKLAHVREGFAAGASGVAVASMFAFSDKSPVKVRSWLRSEGVGVRA